MQPRQNKGNSGHSPPLCIPSQRPVLESIRVSGPVMLPLPQSGSSCRSRPPTPSVLSLTYSYEEDYCDAETCCSSHSSIKSQPVCPREEIQSCRPPCRSCRSQRNDGQSCRASCRGITRPPVNCAATCKGVDASTDGPVRFYVDHQTSTQIESPETQSMSCCSNTFERRVKTRESSTQISNEVSLCCRPQADALPSPLPECSMCKSGTSSKRSSQSMSATTGPRKSCCTISDAPYESGQEVQSCTMVPVLQKNPNRTNNGIANASFQKLATNSACQNRDKKRSESKADVSTGLCNDAKCPANTMTCPCRFPPAYSHFECTGNIAGTCSCAQNK